MSTTIFTELLRQHPSLGPVCEKICRRCYQKGGLNGTMKLGRQPDRIQLGALGAVVGLAPLTISATGEVHLSFTRLFQGKSREERDAWIDGLHEALGLARRHRRVEEEQSQQAAETLLARLRLAFPELTPIHDHLAGQFETVCRLAITGLDLLQEEYFRAGVIVNFLRRNREPVTFSELGAQYCGDSKALRRTGLTGLVADWLRIMEEQENDAWNDGAETVWTRHHVVQDRLAVQATVFGPLLYKKNGRPHHLIHELWQAGEPATLSWQNIAGIERLCPARATAADFELITCENEATFSRLVRDRQPGVLLYTCGFPNDAVLSLYRLLAPESLRCRHWGDSDLAGLRIAAMLHAVHPLQLWRSDLATLTRHQDRLLPLTSEQQNQVDRFLARHPDFPFGAELRFTREHGWLEQESWQNGTENG